jgi:hypothetical protein
MLLPPFRTGSASGEKAAHNSTNRGCLQAKGRDGLPNRSEPDWRLRAIEVNRPYLKP